MVYCGALNMMTFLQTFFCSYSDTIEKKDSKSFFHINQTAPQNKKGTISWKQMYLASYLNLLNSMQAGKLPKEKPL